ncbi:MAG: hypothetical protein PWQ72_1021 [Pseudothermotoga sp.]|nr:hypothetical protein [Pseudothermotoga sp.]
MQEGGIILQRQMRFYNRISRFILFSVVILSINLYAAIDLPGKDPDQSWQELIEQIKRSPDSTVVLYEGPKISAKRRLAEFDDLKLAVINEDIDGFIKSLSDSVDLQIDAIKEVFLIFPQFEKYSMEFESGNFETLYKIKSLWKIGIKLTAPDGFGKWLVENFLKDPYFFDWNLLGFLKNLTNADKVALEIADVCNIYKYQEDLYPFLHRLFGITSQIGNVQPSYLQNQIDLYISLLTRIERSDGLSLTADQLFQMISDFDNLTIEKNDLRKRLSFLIQSAQQTGKKFSEISSRDSQIAALLKKSHSENHSGMKILIAGFVMIIVILMAFDRLRLRIFIILGAKKAAMKICKKILLKDPSNLKIRFSLAMLYEQLGDVEQALKEYQCIKDLSRMFKKEEND